MALSEERAALFLFNLLLVYTLVEHHKATKSAAQAHKDIKTKAETEGRLGIIVRKIIKFSFSKYTKK